MIDSTANRLAYILSERDMKPAELSRQSGICKSSITAYLKGEYAPKQTAIYKMARVLDVSEAWLIGLDVPMERSALWADSGDREFADSVFDKISPEEELTEKQRAIKLILNEIGRDIVKVHGRINYIGDKGAFVMDQSEIDELFDVARASILSVISVIERNRRDGNS